MTPVPMGFKANLGSFTGLTVIATTSAAGKVVPNRYASGHAGIPFRWADLSRDSVSLAILLAAAGGYFLG
jgi:mannose/fructose/N-acetylgalactosamine-specific phosphotransferase system component IIC